MPPSIYMHILSFSIESNRVHKCCTINANVLRLGNILRSSFLAYSTYIVPINKIIFFSTHPYVQMRVKDIKDGNCTKNNRCTTMHENFLSRKLYNDQNSPSPKASLIYLDLEGFSVHSCLSQLNFSHLCFISNHLPTKG